MKKILNIALSQRNFCVGDIVGNAGIIERDIIAARDNGDDLIVFPELSLCGYPPEDLLLRADFLDETENALRRIASVAEGIDVVVGVPVRDDNALFNSAVWMRNGRVFARYDKQCLPNYEVFDEHRYFRPGTGMVTAEIRGLRVALSVCEDLWYADFAKSMRDERVDLLLNCSASPFHIAKSAHRDVALAECARTIRAPIAYVNCVGGQDELVFDGDSRVTDDGGATVLAAPLFDECVLRCTLHDGVPQPELPQPARPGEDELIWCALSVGLRDYVRKSGFDNVIVGVSGGIDSAVVLVLAAEVFGGDNVRALMLPSPYTSRESIEDARAIADACGARYTEIDIEPVFRTALQQLGGDFGDTPTDITGQNLQARVRGLLLMAHANKAGGLLLATGNKSEMATGYATLYGDMAGAYAPLKDVSKTKVYRLAHYSNTKCRRIPQRVIERAPTAELAPGQLDSQSLPPYKILDFVIETFIENDASLRDVSGQGIDADVVRQIQSMVYANEYKRRQAPPGTRVTGKAFGKDRRYPIVSRFRPG